MAFGKKEKKRGKREQCFDGHDYALDDQCDNQGEAASDLPEPRPQAASMGGLDLPDHILIAELEHRGYSVKKV